MTAEDSQIESKIRRDTRAPLVAPVELEYTEEKSKEPTYTANVSLEGLFVLTSNPKPVGTRLRFELQIRSDRPAIRGFGEVRWIRVRDEGRGRPAGMGIKTSLMIGEEGQELLRETIAGALEASVKAGGPVPAEALSLSSPGAKEALAKARLPESRAEGTPAPSPADRVVRQQARKFGYGKHAERAAELRSKRLGQKTSSSKLSQLLGRDGAPINRNLLFLVIFILLALVVIFIIL